VTVGVETLPGAIALAARARDFTVTSVGVARSGGNPLLALISFGSYKLMFKGNLELVLNESISTLEKAIRREQGRRNSPISSRASPVDRDLESSKVQRRCRGQNPPHVRTVVHRPRPVDGNQRCRRSTPL
jgi:hypothetical protein